MRYAEPSAGVHEPRLNVCSAEPENNWKCKICNTRDRYPPVFNFPTLRALRWKIPTLLIWTQKSHRSNPSWFLCGRGDTSLKKYYISSTVKIPRLKKPEQLTCSPKQLIQLLQHWKDPCSQGHSWFGWCLPQSFQRTLNISDKYQSLWSDPGPSAPPATHSHSLWPLPPQKNSFQPFLCFGPLSP